MRAAVTLRTKILALGSKSQTPLTARCPWTARREPTPDPKRGTRRIRADGGGLRVLRSQGDRRQLGLL